MTMKTATGVIPLRTKRSDYRLNLKVLGVRDTDLRDLPMLHLAMQLFRCRYKRGTYLAAVVVCSSC